MFKSTTARRAAASFGGTPLSCQLSRRYGRFNAGSRIVSHPSGSYPPLQRWGSLSLSAESGLFLESRARDHKEYKLGDSSADRNTIVWHYVKQGENPLATALLALHRIASEWGQIGAPRKSSAGAFWGADRYPLKIPLPDNPP